jgi:hypothetical protein
MVSSELLYVFFGKPCYVEVSVDADVISKNVVTLWDILVVLLRGFCWL